MKLVKQYQDSRAILIYANDPINSELANEPNITKVTKDTSDADLRSMDVQKGGVYPVYLINEDYGIRGLDYRAPGNIHGICMIIAGQFSAPRTRLQALRRICRYGDAGMYVQNDEEEPINKDKFVALKGRIAIAEKEV